MGQKGAKWRPKCIKKSMFGRGREKGPKKETVLLRNGVILGAVFHQKSMKKSIRESMPKKHEFHEISSRKKYRI